MTDHFFATRLAAVKPSPSMAAKARVDALRASGKTILDFTIGEPDMDTPAHIIQAAITAMQNGQTRYTGSTGTVALRKAIQSKFKRENGLHYELDQIIVGTGAKQLIYTALQATLNPGDEVLIPAPYWVSYPDMVVLNDGVPKILPTDASTDFKITADQLAAAITPHTKWLMLNSPSNPTGAIYSRAELEALAGVLAKHPHVHVLTDEIYEHIAFGPEPVTAFAAVCPELEQRTLSINGVSKAYSMTGWRVGYAGGPAALIRAMALLISQSTSCVNAISQAAAVEALSADQSTVREASATFKERSQLLVQLLNQITGIECMQPDGAFYVFPSVQGLLGKVSPDGTTLSTDLDVANYFLEAANVAVMDGTSYGAPGYLRLSFATSLDDIKLGCSRLAIACQALRSTSNSSTFIGD